MNSRNKAWIAALSGLAAGALLLVPASALAQGSSVETYGGAGGEVQSAVDEGANGASGSNGSQAQAATPTEVSDGGGSLPFTGLDIGLALGGALLLIGVGAVMARVVPRASES